MNADPRAGEAIAEIGEGFLACTLPPERFDHRAHLIATTYVLNTYPDRDWDEDLPRRIRAFNVSAGGTNSDTSGYHHTITAAFLAVIRAIMHQAGPCDVDALCAAMLTSSAGERDFLMRFWSHQVLFSREARIGWVPPDLRPVDWSAATALTPRTDGSSWT